MTLQKHFLGDHTKAVNTPGKHSQQKHPIADQNFPLELNGLKPKLLAPCVTSLLPTKRTNSTGIFFRNGMLP